MYTDELQAAPTIDVQCFDRFKDSGNIRVHMVPSTF